MAMKFTKKVDFVCIAATAFIFVSSVFALPAMALPVWICTYQPDDKGIDPVTNKFVETNEKVLSAYTDDYTGKPVLYDIVENSGSGFIAVFHYSNPSPAHKVNSMGLTTILLDKKTGDFRQYGYLVRTKFEDRYSGHCVLEALKK